MFHALFGRGPRIEDADAFERKLYVIRKRFEAEIADSGLDDHKFFYFSSLSCRTLVYKGMLTPSQVGALLRTTTWAIRCWTSAICMFHSRFSTNTFPSWQLAHPYRMISHNGEINTLRGNINWMRPARPSSPRELYEPGDIAKLKPIIREGLSDTACLDNAIELLVRSGYSLPHAMMMLIPEAWDHHESMSQVKKDFYQYHSCLMEPWDGPASVAFTDGKNIGAVLDRNGLRPSRYVVTKDDRVIMASEVGALEIAPEDVLKKGRLEPGKMFLVDLEQGRIVDDEELKQQIASAKPYGKWLREYMVPLAEPAAGARHPRPRSPHPAPAAAGVRLHPGRPQVHPRPDGDQRRGSARLDGQRHPPGRALRPCPAAVQLLQAALRPGDQPAARRDPRGAGDLGLHGRRGRGQPARAHARIVPPDRARPADPR